MKKIHFRQIWKQNENTKPHVSSMHTILYNFVDKFSSFKKTIKVVAYCLRFAENAKTEKKLKSMKTKPLK